MATSRSPGRIPFSAATVSGLTSRMKSSPFSIPAAGRFFAVAMGMDCTMKGMGRQKMDEIALYEVKDGKIVREQFFY